MASTLSSSSTYDEARAAYFDNASYEEDGSVSKAAAFITACRFLRLHIVKRVASGGRGGEETEFEPAVLREEAVDARRFAARASTGAVLHPDFTNFRS